MVLLEDLLETCVLDANRVCVNRVCVVLLEHLLKVCVVLLEHLLKVSRSKRKCGPGLGSLLLD